MDSNFMLYENSKRGKVILTYGVSVLCEITVSFNNYVCTITNIDFTSREWANQTSCLLIADFFSDLYDQISVIVIKMNDCDFNENEILENAFRRIGYDVKLAK